jgi:hypothetical protein
MDSERTFIGRLALVVLVVGLLGGLAVGSFASTPSALRFALVSEGLAAVLGFIGWPALSGRLAALAGTVLALALAAALVYEEMRLQKAESAPRADQSRGLGQIQPEVREYYSFLLTERVGAT